MFCGLCGDHARHPKSPQVDLRRKDCPRFPHRDAPRRVSALPSAEGRGGVVHRGCCAAEPCSDIDARGHVRCGWETGGKERLLASLIERERAAEHEVATVRP